MFFLFKMHCLAVCQLSVAASRIWQTTVAAWLLWDTEDFVAYWDACHDTIIDIIDRPAEAKGLKDSQCQLLCVPVFLSFWIILRHAEARSQTLLHIYRNLNRICIFKPLKLNLQNRHISWGLSWCVEILQTLLVQSRRKPPGKYGWIDSISVSNYLEKFIHQII